ncbi:hypothetical protein GO986_17460, partial [Deinococcus sp. HMF7620]
MNEDQTALLTALPSGEYQQTRNRLRRGDCFCVMGVAGDVAVKKGAATWHGEQLLVGDTYSQMDLPAQGHGLNLTRRDFEIPVSMLAQATRRRLDFMDVIQNGRVHIIDLNDDQHLNFMGCADL